MPFNTAILEFDKVKAIVADRAHTVRGKAIAMAFAPSANELEIRRQLGETAHALDILNRYQEPPFGGIRDVTDILQRAKIYSVLRPAQFLDVIGLIEAGANNIRFYKQVKANDIPGNALDDYYLSLQSITGLKQAIEQVITVDGQIHDNASSDLLKIRNKITRNEQKINEKLQHILNSQKNRLAEQLITIRNNRFVVPVKISEKNNFQGTIIDYSASGETAFMEPTSVAEINNQVSLLKIEEEREVERILRDLTIQVAEHHQPLLTNFQLLSELDAIFAKAKFALIHECRMPAITESEIDLRKARHPLIDPEAVVANTIRFNQGERVIIITGPNTGGKTVALKTMGLLSIMVQSGMLIPVDEESKTVIFDNIFADIGDEQSIEQSLSTFSSHMSRIISILQDMTVGSLILLDELGSGTDPKEGASLAISLLDHLRIRGVYVIATTHYPELKAYAYDKPEIVNASVEFDVDTLSPTYRLLLGTPGRSNALLISERLGLPEAIVTAAKDHVLTSDTDVSMLINKLEQQGQILDRKIQDYEQLITKNKELVKQNEQFQVDLMKEKQKYQRNVSIEHSQVVREARAQAEQLIAEIEALKDKGAIKEHEIAELKYKTRQLEINEDATSSTTDHVYQTGDIVNILKFNRTGELIKQQNNGEWVVKMGALTSQFAADELEYIEPKKPRKQVAKVTKKVKKTVRGELDLRGMRYEEAKLELDRYIDDCLVANMPFATIIHGFGTLTLRKLVKQYLDISPHVKSHRDGEGNEGGNGVTIVNFK